MKRKSRKISMVVSLMLMVTMLFSTSSIWAVDNNKTKDTESNEISRRYVVSCPNGGIHGTFNGNLSQDSFWRGFEFVAA
ncbi:hypothetical protein RBG61_05675 [Paludicola sp. MB14-C6]|uniref:hypothetical protein n=1 Tax=Paludihabitans sp. MB14-C6 TaxID=3070656 RepID=UPI0027DDA1D3|nr:hypothetical protein [Paludicola sp. MB14-C6]WMJ24154.1 hypothetical protein RBG61_05675 [Paludicola sp. MB14-C6]